jgi:hypothetical protein
MLKDTQSLDTGTGPVPVQHPVGHAHTPGPWRLTDDGQITADARDGKVEIAVIELDFDEPFEREQRANARLMVAAPELLDALEQAEAFIDDELECRERSGMDENAEYIAEAKAVLEAVRAAIIKAMG